MDQKQRLFIYGRREVSVLIFLGLLVAVFAFTLGVHLGKKVVARPVAPGAKSAVAVATVPDSVQDGQEMADHAKAAQQAADESLTRSLQEEVNRTGIKLDTPRQVDLPTKAKSETAAAPARAPAIPRGGFTLQIGSHQAMTEAQEQLKALESAGLKPFMREADLKEKGKWYRVFIGVFPSKAVAEKAGEQYKIRKVIRSYVVSKVSD